MWEFYSTHGDFLKCGLVCNWWPYCVSKHSLGRKPRKTFHESTKWISSLSVELFQAVNHESVELRESFLHIYKHWLNCLWPIVFLSTLFGSHLTRDETTAIYTRVLMRNSSVVYLCVFVYLCVWVQVCVCVQMRAVVSFVLTVLCLGWNKHAYTLTITSGFNNKHTHKDVWQCWYDVSLTSTQMKASSSGSSRVRSHTRHDGEAS